MAFAKKDDVSQSRSQSRYRVYCIFEIYSGGNLDNQMQIGSQIRPRIEMQCTEHIILCSRVESPYTTGDVYY